MSTDLVVLALIVGLVVAISMASRAAGEARSLKKQCTVLARETEQLKLGKTVHDELLEAWSEKITARVEKLSTEDTARLDDLLRDALPQAVRAALANPSPDLLDALRARLEPEAVRLAKSPPPALAAHFEQKIGEALQTHVQQVFQDPDDYPDIAETISETLSNRIGQLAANLPLQAATEIDQKISECLVSAAESIFTDPDQYAEVADQVNEALGSRIVTLAEGPTGDIAARLDEHIGNHLVDSLKYLFDNAGDYEAVFQSLDEKLGERMIHLAENPPRDVAERLDPAIGAALLSRVQAIFKDLSADPELEQKIYGRMYLRIERKLLEQTGNGSEGEGRLDKAVDEMLQDHLSRRFQQADLKGMNRMIDDRLKAAVDTPSAEMLAQLDRMFEARLLSRGRERLMDKIKECEEDLEEALLLRLQARVRAFPQSGCAAVDELIDMKLPGWFEDRLGESFQVNQVVARHVALRVDGWISAALDQPKPVLKNALENWITRQVLTTLKANPLGADINQM